VLPSAEFDAGMTADEIECIEEGGAILLSPSFPSACN